MAAKWVDLLRMRLGSSPSIEQAITRPDISFLQTSAGLIRIRDSGGHNPSVIFACDAPNVLEHYDAVFELLSPAYRLISVEMPGFGFSIPNSTFDFSLPQFVTIIAQAITKLRAGPATLVFPCAWSYAAMQLAAGQPTLVDRLIVTQCPHWDEERVWTRRIDLRGMIGTPFIGQLFLALAPQRVSDTWYNVALAPGQPTQTWAEPARKVLSNGGIFCLASLIQTWFNSATSDFGPVVQPTVVMWGASDRTHRHSNPDSVLSYLQNGKVLVYPKAGHFPELEDPQRLKDLLSNRELWDSLKTQEENASKENKEIKEGMGPKGVAGSSGSRAEQPVWGRRTPFDSRL
jgi:pimeloyl-ACP methyl ester carboxylesterase